MRGVVCCCSGEPKGRILRFVQGVQIGDEDLC